MHFAMYLCLLEKGIPEMYEVLLAVPLIKTSMLTLGTMMFSAFNFGEDSTVLHNIICWPLPSDQSFL